MYISLFLHLLILSSFSTTTFALWIVKQDCSTSDNYTSGSTFRSNLDQFLSSVTEKTVKNDWFFNDTVGKAPYQVYGLARCYFDVFSSDRCRICLTEAALNITQRCPYSSSAAVWYYECFLRYSQQNFFTIESTSTTYVERSVDEVSDPEIFSQVLGSLMAKLSNDVVNSSILVAVGEANYTTFQKVYGLVECTRDLPALQCQRCIVVDLGWLPHGSNVARAGCRMFGPSCYLRYELYPFCPTIPPPPSPLQTIDSQDRKKSLITRYIIIALACAVALLLVILITSGLLCFRRKRSRTIDNDERQQRHSAGSSADIRKPNFQQGTKLIMFDFDTIQEATDNFSDENKLGEGGFGQVFKGRLQNGPELAVKRLATTSVQGIVELKNEVELLGRLTHRNLVQVLGYCIQEKEKLLCYEYLSNGSLDMILFATDSMKHKVLDWNMRFNIIEGICRGLVYLHAESGATIIHRDLKASNILLDGSMNPKISDFGLARLFDGDKTHRSTIHVAGTFGYIAPEYLMHLTFSPKSDVFSFGVLILEIMTGRKCSTNLINYVWQHWTKGKVQELKDPTLPATNLDQVTKCIHIGLLCVQENPEQRPSISDVNFMLHGHPLSLPPLPAGKFIWGAQVLSISEGSSYSTSTEYTNDKFSHRTSNVHIR